MFTSTLLFLIAFLVGADELLLGPILAPIGLDLGVKPERVTFFITAYSLAIALAAPYFGRLSDRIGRMKLIVPACVLFGLASIATGLVDDFEWALVTRVVTGLASAGMLPIAFALAGDQPGKHAMKQIVLVQAGLTLGMIASPGIGALLTEWYSWRVAFIVLGAAALLVALALVFTAKAHFATRLVSRGSGSSFNPLLIPGAAGALMAMGFGLGGGIGVFNLIGQRLRDGAGLEVALIGMVYASLGVVSVLGNLALSRVMRRAGSGRVVMRGALVVCLGCSLWVFTGDELTFLAAAPVLALWSLAGGVGSPALQNHIAQLSETDRGALMAMGMSMMHLGVALWSGSAGLAYSLGAPWVAGLAAVVFGVAILALRPVGKSS
ncbi:MFS transporter [Photobacterium atrarenae]|uniref:MFS transporter n=1 Tax=Photobacterium atrarenae TaxID=865757 RepID=A0ABY5GP94_9GAMM|nr:MFS transporter [Photobacterium atrarenae]UTV30899.1 MFS transporter [Photobacterium atrarenae]